MPVTGGDGVATLGGWTLGQKAGANTVAATLSGLEVSGSPVMFIATGTPAAVDAAKSQRQRGARGRLRVGRVEHEHDHGDRARRVRQPDPRARGHARRDRRRRRADAAGAPTGSDGTATGAFSATTPGEHVVSATIAGRAGDRRPPR